MTVTGEWARISN